MPVTDTELVKKYKVSENIPDEAEITKEMVMHHWDLERELTRQLLKSTPETRWQDFERAYSIFYEELPWLNLYTGKADMRPAGERYKDWLVEIGSPPKKIYEIGSGNAEMLSYFAELGFQCRATEVTQERGEKFLSQSCANLSWGNCDGVHLDLFETENTYDVVISNQVIEHFHPDDVLAHFASVRNILVTGGLYIFNTPHKYAGPHDVSQVFGCDDPEGLHLKEYTYSDLVRVAKEAGFRESHYVIPVRLRNLAKKFGVSEYNQVKRLEWVYLQFMMGIERLLSAIPKGRPRRFGARMLKKAKVFKDDVFLAAQK